MKRPACSACSAFSAVPLAIAIACTLFAGCHTSTGAQTPIGKLGDCIETEAAVLKSGKSILDIAEAVASTIALAVTGGGLPAAEAGIEALIAQYGEPIIACATLKGAAPTTTIAGAGTSGVNSGSATSPASAAKLITTPIGDPATIRRLLANIHGWREQAPAPAASSPAPGSK